MKVVIAKDKLELGRMASEDGAAIIRDAIAERGEANIIVATGASQFEMLANLVKAENIRWDKVTAFHLDEYVGMDIVHPASFRLYLWRRFVSQLPLPLRAFRYLDASSSPAKEAEEAGDMIRKHPIDVAFVGIGENGHMAFNDPPADFETEEPYIVVDLDEACRRQQLGEGWFKTLDEVPMQAISMSIKRILESREIICSVPDKRKARAIADTWARDPDPKYPSTCLKMHKSVRLYLDPDSSSLLPKEALKG